MRKLHATALAVAGGVAVAAIGGAVGVSAATPAAPTPSSKPTKATTSKAHRHCPPSKVTGSLVSDTSTGGLAGHGTIVIEQPDGKSLTLDLTAHTKVMKFNGHGVPPTLESLSSISSSTSTSPGDVLVVTGRHLYGKKPLVGHILDLGK